MRIIVRCARARARAAGRAGLPPCAAATARPGPLSVLHWRRRSCQGGPWSGALGPHAREPAAAPASACLRPRPPGRCAYNGPLPRLSVGEDAGELCRQGDQYARRGNVGKALACFEKAAAIAPGMANAHCLKGRALAALDRHNEALASFRTTLDLDPNNAFAYAGIGGALVELGKPAKARKYLKKAVQLDPDDPVAYTEMGRAFLSMGRPEMSIKWFDRSINVEPTAGGYGGKAEALASMGRNKEAAKLFGRAAKA